MLFMPKAKKNDNRADDLKWGEVKRHKAFLLTETCSALLDDAAARAGTTRSETLEQILRAAAPLWPNFTNPSPNTSDGSKGGRHTSKVVSAMKARQQSLFSSES